MCLVLGETADLDIKQLNGRVKSIHCIYWCISYTIYEYRILIGQERGLQK